jgi:non-homologous end joining protein Ku
MAEKPSSDRAFSSDVTLSIGMLSVNGDLQTIPKPNSGKSDLKSVCPKCETPEHFMNSKLVCADNPAHGTFAQSEIKKGRQVGDKIVVVDATAVKDARKSELPEKTLNLQVHARADVEKNTFPMGNAYVFSPKGSSPFAAVLMDIIRARPDIALIAKTNLKQVDHLMMLDVEMGQLVVRDLIWPEDMKTFSAPAFPAIPDKDREKLAKQAETLLEVSIEPFDRDEYKKDSKARVEAVVADATNGVIPDTKKAAKKQAKDTSADLSAMIDAAIKAAKAA